MKFTLFVFLIFALILEASITTIPLIFILLNCYAVVSKKPHIFIFAFIFGLLFDILSFKTVGLASIFYITFIFFVFLYQRKFEIRNLIFVFSSTFLGSLAFLLLYQYNSYIIFSSIVSSVFSILFFLIFKKLFMPQIARENQHG